MNTNNNYFNQENNQCETGYTGAECTEKQTKPIKVTDQQKGLILRSTQVSGGDIYAPIVQAVAASTNQSPSSVTREIKGIDAEVRSSFSYLKQKFNCCCTQFVLCQKYYFITQIYQVIFFDVFSLSYIANWVQ